MLIIGLFLLLLTFTDFSCSRTTATATAINSDVLKLPLLHINPFPTPSQALSSDNYRLAALHRRPKLPLTSGASTGAGQYFVDIHLGSPPQSLLLVADTGSDLTWVTCSACRNCSRRQPRSAFLARHSSTFCLHHCFDPACKLVLHPKGGACNHTRLHSPCRYEYSYSDGSLTSGFFAKETTSFNTSSGRLLEYDGLAFGCGFRASGPSVSGPSFNGAQGVMGLGRGPISFASQLGRRFGNKFSYCLMDYTISPSPTSYLLIGGPRNDSGAGIMSYTPLQTNPLSPTFYYIGIKSVSVDKVNLQISPSVWAIDRFGNGGTILDTGTTLTFLPEPVYRRVLTAVTRRVKLPTLDQPASNLDLCVNVSGAARPSLPRLSFKLAGGSVLSPPTGNYFINTAENVKCLALQPVASLGGFSVIGNLMQQGYLFEFDIDKSRLGFSRRGCSRG